MTTQPLDGPEKGSLMTTQLRAIVFVPEIEGADEWTDACTAHVDRHGYALTGVVRTYDEAAAAIREDRADILVLADRAHLPDNIVPRIEDTDGNVEPVWRPYRA